MSNHWLAFIFTFRCCFNHPKRNSSWWCKQSCGTYSQMVNKCYQLSPHWKVRNFSDYCWCLWTHRLTDKGHYLSSPRWTHVGRRSMMPAYEFRTQSVCLLLLSGVCQNGNASTLHTHELHPLVALATSQPAMCIKVCSHCHPDNTPAYTMSKVYLHSKIVWLQDN